MASTSSQMTAERLLHEAPVLGRCELVRGELQMMSPAGSRHGAVTLRITTLLANQVETQGLGQVLPPRPASSSPAIPTRCELPTWPSSVAIASPAVCLPVTSRARRIWS